MYQTRINGFFREHLPYPPTEINNPIVSQTGELSWYHDTENGLVTIETQRSEGLIGFVKSNQKTLNHLDVEVKNSFCSIMLISMDNDIIAKSEKLLLVTTATSGHSGMTYNESRTELLDEGDKPTVIEPVIGTITINNLQDVKYAELVSIDGNGLKIDSRKVKINSSGALEFKIGEVTTPLYVINIIR